MIPSMQSCEIVLLYMPRIFAASDLRRVARGESLGVAARQTDAFASDHDGGRRTAKTGRLEYLGSFVGIVPRNVLEQRILGRRPWWFLLVRDGQTQLAKPIGNHPVRFAELLRQSLHSAYGSARFLEVGP